LDMLVKGADRVKVVPPPAGVPPPDVTVKLVAEVAVPPAVVTDIVPVVAPAGTFTDISVPTPWTTPCTPLNLTSYFGPPSGPAPKLVPIMVTVVPTGPLVGVKDVMVGAGGVEAGGVV
jgi:hypothetical protein